MSEIRFDRLGPGDYDRAKTVLNKAKHPGFVGRELFFRCATNGAAVVAVLDDADSAVMLVTKNRIEALSVITKAQGRGVGQALVLHLKPRFVNAIGERIGFFEKLGYKPVGAPKIGQNGKHSTQLMQRDESADVADVQIRDAVQADEQEGQLVTVQFFATMLDMSKAERIAAELELLDMLLSAAIANERDDGVLKLTEAANQLLNEYDYDRRRAKRES